MKILDVKNLTLQSNSGKTILKNFNFSLDSGMIHALVGSSGSGKSSFGYAILNLLDENLSLNFERFQILQRDWEGISLKDWETMRGKEIYLIPQNPIHAFHPYMSLGTQISDYFISKNLKISKEEVLERFSSIGIREPQKKWNSRPGDISGGERQRIMIGLSLFSQPKLIIADEPTTALDAKNEKLVLETFYKVIKEGNISVVLISHDRRIVREFSDVVTVLDKGLIVEKFQIENTIYPVFKYNYTKELLEEKG